MNEFAPYGAVDKVSRASAEPCSVARYDVLGLEMLLHAKGGSDAVVSFRERQAS